MRGSVVSAAEGAPSCAATERNTVREVVKRQADLAGVGASGYWAT